MATNKQVGEAEAPGAGLPGHVRTMTRTALEEIGMNDDLLEFERERLFGPADTGKRKLGTDEIDDLGLKARRREVYDQVMAQWQLASESDEATP